MLEKSNCTSHPLLSQLPAVAFILYLIWTICVVEWYYSVRITSFYSAIQQLSREFTWCWFLYSQDIVPHASVTGIGFSRVRIYFVCCQIQPSIWKHTLFHDKRCKKKKSQATILTCVNHWDSAIFNDARPIYTRIWPPIFSRFQTAFGNSLVQKETLN